MPKGQSTPGNLSQKVDRDLLHEYLWKQTDKNGRMLITQKELAERLDMNRYHLNTIFREMIMAGRVRRSGAAFFITDPMHWQWTNRTAEPPPTLFQ